MSDEKEITVHADALVKRLLGKRIRIQADGFDGYGEVREVTGHVDGRFDSVDHFAIIMVELEEPDAATSADIVIDVDSE